MFLFQLAFAFNFPTTLEGWIYEAVGILASLFVFVSFFWSNEKLTRIINMVGCIVFVIYAILIGSVSVCVMNSACLILHIVKLVQMRLKKNGKSEEPDQQKEGTSNQDSSEEE